MRVNHVEYDENLYTYDELSEEAKEKAKQDYLQFHGEADGDVFYDMIMDNLSEQFPNSDLDVQYSLSYRQGDGLNIYGKVSMNDFMPYFNATDNSKSEMLRYIDYLNDYYGTAYVKLSENQQRYEYSYKFIDIKNAQYAVDDIISDLQKYEDFEDIANINEDTIKDFVAQVYEYFQELDRTWENTGYEFFYEISDEEMQEISDANEYEYYEDGRLAG